MAYGDALAQYQNYMSRGNSLGGNQTPGMGQLTQQITPNYMGLGQGNSLQSLLGGGKQNPSSLSINIKFPKTGQENIWSLITQLLTSGQGKRQTPTQPVAQNPNSSFLTPTRTAL